MNNGSAGDNCEDTTVIDYNLSDFVDQFYRNSLTNPCCLCGIVHSGSIHAYVERKYRDRESGENITIVIPVIGCAVARARGKQYTKRLLPDVLIPYSVIRLDYLVEAAGLGEDERSGERVCELIGCVDLRTARNRMRRLTAAIGEVSLDLSRRRAATPELGEMPETSPDTSPLQRLRRLYEAETQAGERAGATRVLPSLRYLLQAAMRKHHRKKPSASVSPPARPP